MIAEYALLTGQAVKIIENLDQADDDDVSASEYNALAEALSHLPGGQEEARTYFQRAAGSGKQLDRGDHSGAMDRDTGESNGFS